MRCTPSFRRGAISRQRRLRAFAAGQAVGDDADLMAAVDLAVGEVEDVTENAADRRAHRVQDTKRPVGRRHDHRRSRMPVRGPAERARQAHGRQRRERPASDSPWENLDSD